VPRLQVSERQKHVGNCNTATLTLRAGELDERRRANAAALRVVAAELEERSAAAYAAEVTRTAREMRRRATGAERALAMTDDVLRTAMFVVGTALPAAQDAMEYAKTVRSNLVRLWAALTPRASP
jgi:hypothetical protein